MDILKRVEELQDLFDEDEVTTADKINRPEPKQSVKEIDLFNEFNIRNPKAGGGMLVQPSADGSRPGYAKQKLPKNIRLTPEGNYRFSTEAGGGFSKNFPKGTKLKEVEDFRDKKLKEFGIEKGKLRKGPNPDRGKYKAVEGQKHIKFNGINYQVALQRGDEGAQYFSSLKDAIKERNRLVTKYPPKSLTEYNIKEKPKKVNAEILKLSKDPTIKNIFKTGELTNKAITKAANILKVDRATAIDRLENLATAYSGDRKNVPGIKPTFTKNAKKIAASLPGAKTKAAELATGVPFTGQSIKVPKTQIVKDAPYISSIYDIDEARATATGLKRGTSPYSIFGQIIKKEINRDVKGGFSGSGWDSRAGTLEKNLDEAIENFGPKSNQAKVAKNQYNKEATLFENKINKNKRPGAKKIEIPRISLDAPSKTIANYKNLNKTYKNVFDTNFKTKKYSFKIPKNLNPIPKIVEDFKDPKIKAKVERASTLGDARVYANPFFSPGVLGEALKTIPTPAGAVGLNLGFGVDPTSAIDRASIAAEAAFAPQLVKQSAKFGPAVQRFLNLGLSPALAARVARVASPLGIASLIGEASIAGAKNISQEANRIDSIKDPNLQSLEFENLIRNIKGFADGGLSGGDKSGPPPESGPTPHGLQGILNRVKRT